ncbi:MAG: AsmA family protein [Bacteroidota bacterium]
MKKTVKISIITLSILLVTLLFLVLTPFLFKDKFTSIVKNTANKTLLTDVNFSGMDVSFFHHFPNLTISLTDFSLKSSAPFATDTLIKARDISFGVNLRSLFSGPIKINKVYLNKAHIVVQYNLQGRSNFDVFASSADTIVKKDTASSETAALQIESIVFTQTDFIYADPSIPLKFELLGIDYKGSSDLQKDILNLRSKVKVNALNVVYDNVAYIKSKPLKGQLTTSINLNSLNMKFEKNDLFIKDFPFGFKGELAFTKDGYSFDVSLLSKVEQETLSASLKMVSNKNLWISARADMNINLEKWASAFGADDYELGGMLTLNMKAEGNYLSGQNPKSSKPDTVILSVPDFTLSSKLTKGFFKYKKFPQGVSDISFSLNASSTNHDYNTINLQLEGLNASFLKNKIEGYFRLKGFDDMPVESHFSTSINLAEIAQVIPLDSMSLSGQLDMNLDMKGKYAPDKKLFPVTQLKLVLKDGVIQTKYYPKPVEKMQVTASITNTTGTLAGTHIVLSPASFSFQGNPFEIKADLSNPDNLDYDVSSKGSIDIASLYKLFPYAGLDVKGYIETDLKLKGNQGDALAGRVAKLQNYGKLTLRDIAFTTEYLPKELLLKSGVFRFENDKVWFEKFESRYGKSDITLNGHLSNITNYVLVPNQVLKGDFAFKSNYLLADEFISSASGSVTSAPASAGNANAQVPSGVIVIPENLEILMRADMKKISFQKLDISNLTAGMEIKKGMILLKEMKYELVGCKVGMEATYGSLSTDKAFFDFHVKADNFDIKRAYNEVEMFRTISTSAGKCEGLVSLDYSLKGKINGAMNPVYPSIEGGGTLTLQRVKVVGLKLFTAMGQNLQKEKIKNPDLSKVDIKSSIKNNVITVENTKFKMAGFRFRIGGETNFSGQLNLKARLGLPPLGIFGISMRVLGTQDKPVFKYGRGTSDKDVDETEYQEDLPKEMLEKIKNAKEEDLKNDSK